MFVFSNENIHTMNEICIYKIKSQIILYIREFFFIIKYLKLLIGQFSLNKLN